MPPSVDTPVQLQLGLRGVLGNGKNGSGGLSNKPPGPRRRIFVQTDTGSVLGIEVDRADNVQTIKKKMQTFLNVPSDQTTLVYGDIVLKSDLSKLRDHSPLLLTREIHRSLSTPCILRSLEKQVPTDGGKPLEVVGGSSACSPEIQNMIEEILCAIESGVEPVAANGGLGGAYFFRNSKGENVAILKPTDEEPFAPNNPKGFVGKSLGQPGLKKAVRVGETGIREVAAYLLDHRHFAKVPPTVLVKVSHSSFNVNNVMDGQHHHKDSEEASCPVSKLASCQQFVPHDFDACDHGTSRFSVSAVHKIGILDIRIFNTDRHAGNILIRMTEPNDCKQGIHAPVSDALELIPIDHGLCLPEALEDPYFEWLHWPQSSLPFSDEELDYIGELNEHKDVEILRQELPMLREACFRILILSTTLLKRAASAGLVLSEIGEMMSRSVMGEPSQLELLCMEARFQLETKNSIPNGAVSDMTISESAFPSSNILGFSSPVKLRSRSVSFGSSQKQKQIDHFSKGKEAMSERIGKSNDCAPAIWFGDMNEEEWSTFMDCFDTLLQNALDNYNLNKNIGYNQRLGISRKF